MNYFDTKITNKQLVHLVYYPRSGSTLFASLLHQHPEIAVSVESGFLKHLSLFKKDYFLSPELIISELEKKVRGFNNLISDKKKLYQILKRLDHINYESAAAAILACHFGPENQQKIWIVKSLDCGWDSFNIKDKISNTKTLHIFRDGRAVLNSLLKTKRVYAKGNMANEPLTPAILWNRWIYHMTSFSNIYPESIYNVRYEDLLSNTDTQLKKVFRFLNISASQTKKNVADDYKQKIPKAEHALHPNVGKAPMLQIASKWKKELPSHYIRVFEAIAGEALIQKGYPLIYGNGWKEKFYPRVIVEYETSFMKILGRKFLRFINRYK